MFLNKAYKVAIFIYSYDIQRHHPLFIVITSKGTIYSYDIQRHYSLSVVMTYKGTIYSYDMQKHHP